MTKARLSSMLLALLALVFAGRAALAQGELGPGLQKETAKQQTERFYNRCLKNPVLPSSEQTNLAFCACSASHMQRWLEKPVDTAGLEFYEAAPSKEPDADTLTTKIYAPCLYIPLYDTTYEKCLASEKHNYFMKNAKELEVLCNCLATGTEEYFRDFAQPYLEMRIAQGAEFKDPVHEITRSKDYYIMKQRHESACYKLIRRQRN